MFMFLEGSATLMQSLPELLGVFTPSIVLPSDQKGLLITFFLIDGYLLNSILFT